MKIKMVSLIFFYTKNLMYFTVFSRGKTVITRHILLVLLLCLAGHQTLQGQLVQWARKMGGSVNEAAHAITTDAAGNIYTTGFYGGTCDFDPGPGVYNLTSISWSSDVFISKIDANGNFLWAKSIGSSSVEGSTAIDIDANGDILITGLFSSSIDFDPGPGLFLLTSSGGSDVFVLKLSATGNFINAAKFGGSVSDRCTDLIVDLSGDIIITGVFMGSGDFDPGPTVFMLNNNGAEDIFVAKLNSSLGIIWVQSMGGAGIDSPGRIAGISSGNLIVTGQFTGTADFDPSPGISNLSSMGDTDVFICMLSPSGNLVSVISFGSYGQEMATAVNADSFDNIIVSGYFQNTIDFDPGPGIHLITASGNQDGFTIKFNNSLVFQNGISFGGSGNTTQIWDSAIDGLGNIYLLTRFTFTTDADPGTGVINHTSIGGMDFYVEKLNTSLNYIWSRNAGGTLNELAFCLTYHPSGSIIAAGAFAGTSNFNPPGSMPISAASSDIFIVKYQTNIVLPVELSNLSASCNSDYRFFIRWTVASEHNASHYVVERSFDGDHFEEVVFVEATGNSTSTLNYSIHDPDDSKRDRYYRLLLYDSDGVYTISEIIQARCNNLEVDLKVMPNPAKNLCRIDFGSIIKNANLIIYNVIGEIIFKKEIISGNDCVIDVSTWSHGIYYVRINEAQSNLSRKILLQVGK